MNNGGSAQVEDPATDGWRTPEARAGTYRTLDEHGGRLSEAEERFERRRRTAGLFLAPAIFLLLLIRNCCFATARSDPSVAAMTPKQCQGQQMRRRWKVILTAG